MRLRGYYPIANKIRETHLSFMRTSQLNRREVPTGTLYYNILRVLFLKIFNEILFDGYEFRFRKLGKFTTIMFYPSSKITEDGTLVTNKPVDYPSTYKLRKETGNNELKVYFDNEETGGLIYKLAWDTSTTHFTNKSFYSFSLNKDLRKIFSEAAKSGKILAALVNFKI